MKYFIKTIGKTTIPALLLLWGASLTAKTFEHSPLGPEAGFFIDVPDAWQHDAIQRENGALVYFRKDLSQKAAATIEVRSLYLGQKADVKKLLNQKAARLAAQFSRVTLLEEKQSRFKANVLYATWELQLNHVKYIEKSAIVFQEEYAVIVSCLATVDSFAQHRVIFENALLSIRIGEVDEEEEPFIDEEDLTMLLRLKDLYLFNRPNAIKTIIPPKASVEHILKQIEAAKPVVKK